MTDNKVMLNTLRNCHQKEFEEGIKLEQSQWTSGMNKFSSDNSLMDKRRNKRAKARARMQRNYIAAKAQLRSAVLKKDRDLKQGKSKNSIQNNEAFIQVSTAYLTNEEDSMDQLDEELEKITRSMHMEGEIDDEAEGFTYVLDIHQVQEDQTSEDQTSEYQTVSEESVAIYETPRVPKLPEPSTMILRPNHEAFFDEGIGAPVAKRSTLSVENLEPKKPKRPIINFGIRNVIRNAKSTESKKGSKLAALRKNSLAYYFLQCLRPQMQPNEL